MAHNSEAVTAVRSWLDGDDSDLVFVGTVGTGKTRLAGTALNEIVSRGRRSAAFVRVPRLLPLERQSVHNVASRATADELRERCFTVGALVLDDLAGGEPASNFSRATLTTICDARNDAGLLTIWTSNLNLQELSTFYDDDRLSSRLIGRCGEVIEMSGPDLRLREREQLTLHQTVTQLQKRAR